MPFLYQNPDLLCIFNLIIVLGNSASQFLEMPMLISYVGILIQIRVGVGSITFSNMGPMRGKRVFMTISIFSSPEPYSIGRLRRPFVCMSVCVCMCVRVCVVNIFKHLLL